ncbi:MULTISPECIES: hypothetical protein [unclassified Microbacterium]|uniref:hypothetical protein n=1 Tax=unclassified Microbacterium TaxID=2609290 RepID=UPI000EA97028|nr:MULTISPECIES: hypothetical protein [unclassified Microbacterium]MBT2486805.1 hypothetical protein [Microbacterium sp. ISL-108]RKN64730.1 hypothetical protein D7252_19090 [Microbacterium sp. CGR2]
MTDPQLPPPPGAVPPVPPAPSGAIPPAPPAYAAAPPHAAPPGAYQVPVGGYAAPTGAYAVPDDASQPSRLPGILALILAVVAAVVTPIVAAVSGFEIGRRIPQGITTTSSDVLSFLSPARDQVLWAEVAFWTGTVLGIAAIVIGIIAIRKKQGRGAGIAALVVAVLAPMIFFLVLVIAFSAGSAAGFADFTG